MHCVLCERSSHRFCVTLMSERHLILQTCTYFLKLVGEALCPGASYTSSKHRCAHESISGENFGGQVDRIWTSGLCNGLHTPFYTHACVSLRTLVATSRIRSIEQLCTCSTSMELIVVQLTTFFSALSVHHHFLVILMISEHGWRWLADRPPLLRNRDVGVCHVLDFPQHCL